MEKIRGINFGNWLVLEKWMSAAAFGDCPEEDETWLARTTPFEQLAAQMKTHRDTYITGEDFRFVKEHGFNLIRLPVPYFVFGDRPPFIGCIEYVDRAMDWAEQYGIPVLLDLHTSPGSQNGYDNGGITGVCKWCKNSGEVEFELTVLERLAQRYGKRPGLFGIEVLNEPISWIVYVTAPSTGRAKDKEEANGSGFVPLSFLKGFYQDAYCRIRRYMGEDKTIVFHDGFRLSSWNRFFRDSGMVNVLLDTHIYIAAMESFLPLPWEWIYRLFVSWNRRLIRRAAKAVPVVVGEWCIECRRPEMVAKGNDDALRKAYNQVCRMQREAWNESAGWIYWSYQLDREDCRSQTGHAPREAWAMRRCIQRGWWTSES